MTREQADWSGQIDQFPGRTDLPGPRLIAEDPPSGKGDPWERADARPEGDSGQGLEEAQPPPGEFSRATPHLRAPPESPLWEPPGGHVPKNKIRQLRPAICGASRSPRISIVRQVTAWQVAARQVIDFAFRQPEKGHGCGSSSCDGTRGQISTMTRRVLVFKGDLNASWA